ncbi:hypothetical protein CCUS01_14248 [Colletotrichum cuscutae]|uniref:Cyanovirin-N domain-containing protein n=1 Tax=Colletotrichum cuscutae TaxID=1209917 RepID=A0AAJ0DLR0_9PEZI|nr:hypothetical protein CCUS01_14248 [Colletotrichum cuscutae]
MKSSILAALLSIHLFATHLTALATRAATLDRKCPLESDCMENICTNFNFIEKEEKDPLYLVAQCKNKKGNYVYTKLDLKKCIANWDGNLEWTPSCMIISIIALLTGVAAQGIWVSRDGALSCYDMNGEWYV